MKYQLPKEFATKWVKALRSGEYGQTRGEYYSEPFNCYCALGVSFKVIGVQPAQWDAPISDIRWPLLDDMDLKQIIIELNDDRCLTFPEIADWIEANVEFI